MDLMALKFIGIGLLSIAMLGAALGIGNIFASGINAIGRNPAAEGKISKYIYIGGALTESIALFTLTIALIVLFL